MFEPNRTDRSIHNTVITAEGNFYGGHLFMSEKDEFNH
jgi:hypothetical protein